MCRRTICIFVFALLLTGCTRDRIPSATAPQTSGSELSVTAQGERFPTIIPLPLGFRPEGIAVGRGPAFFVGSLADGSIYGGDLHTGVGSILVPASGAPTVGLGYDRFRNRIFSAGGQTGGASVYDADTGGMLLSIELTSPGNGPFINDVIVTRDAAYFTDSFRPVLYRVPVGPHGEFISPDVVDEMSLGGDFVFVPGSFNANGIEATPDGRSLILVNSATGILYRVSPATGTASEIDTEGETFPSGDGLLLDGLTLYVVQNTQNRISVVDLSPDLSSGSLAEVLTDPNFRVPTTVASFGDALYAVNARFGVPPTPETEYEVVRLEKR